MLYRDPLTIEIMNGMFGVNHHLYLNPLPQARHRNSGNRTYDPNAEQKLVLQNLVLDSLNERSAIQITTDMLPLTSSYVSVEMTFFISRPDCHFVNRNRSSNQIRHDYQDAMPTTSGDIDNYAKLFLDVLDGIFYRNDRDVVQIKATKFYCVEPRGRIVYNVRPYEMNTISLIDENDDANEI
jgi:Holliday junction resolvase RusA-like endonuclease